MPLRAFASKQIGVLSDAGMCFQNQSGTNCNRLKWEKRERGSRRYKM